MTSVPLYYKRKLIIFSPLRGKKKNNNTNQKTTVKSEFKPFQGVVKL